MTLLRADAPRTDEEYEAAMVWKIAWEYELEYLWLAYVNTLERHAGAG